MFNSREQELIDFGKFTVCQSLKEMIEEGDNLSTIDFVFLVEKIKRNIVDSDLLQTINNVTSESDLDSQPTNWKEEFK